MFKSITFGCSLCTSLYVITTPGVGLVLINNLCFICRSDRGCY